MMSDVRVQGDRRYCYSVSASWDGSLPLALVVLYAPLGEGPGGGAEVCEWVCRQAGFGGMVVGHLFALRGLGRSDVRRDVKLVGPDNDRVLLEAGEECGLLVAAWGSSGAHSYRSDEVMGLFSGRRWHCFGKNRMGFPVNPVYALPGWRPEGTALNRVLG